MGTVKKLGGGLSVVVGLLLVLAIVAVGIGYASAAGVMMPEGPSEGHFIGWRDIANGLIGILITVIWANVLSMKEEIRRRVETSTYNDSIRRIDHNETQIGTLFSKIHDEEVSRLKSHMDVVVMQNKNQSALLATLASITTRTVNGNGHQDSQSELGGSA